MGTGGRRDAGRATVKRLVAVGLVAAVIAAVLAAGWYALGPAGEEPADRAARQGEDSLLESAPPTLRGSEPAAVLPGDEAAETAGASAPTGDDSILATGRVVDTRRRPVAGASITARSRGTALASTIASTKSDAQGAFTISLGPVPVTALSVALVAIKGDRGARASIYMSPRTPRTFRTRTLVLKPAHALEVLVVADGKPVSGAKVALLDDRDTGVTGLLATGRTDGAGRARFEGLVAARVSVFAHAEGRGRGRAQCELPHEGAAVQVELPPDRALEVTVKHADGGEPIVGAQVFVNDRHTRPMPSGTGCLPEMDLGRTDESGRLRVTGLPSGQLAVSARAEGLAPTQGGMTWKSASVTPEGTQAEVLLYPYRTLRLPITPSAAGAPAEGTTLEVVRHQPIAGDDDGSVAARIEDGHVVISSFPPVFDWGHVLAPDGRWAAFRIPSPGPEAKLEGVFFRPSRKVVVRLVNSAGEALAGEWLWLIVRPRGRGTHRRTDAEGMAVFPALQGDKATVMWTPNERGFGTAIAEVDLGTPDDITEAVVEVPVQIRIALTVDGEARLPTSYSVRVPDARGGAGRLRSVVEAEIEEDADAAEIGLRWLGLAGGGALPVTIEAKGYTAVTVSPTLGSDGLWRGTAALRRATRLTVRVLPPEHKRWHVMLERWSEEFQGFFAAPSDSSMRPTRGASREIHIYNGLRPDRYRLCELVTKHTSEPFEIDARGGEVEIPFDLTVLLLVQGKVIVPEGEDPAFARVVVNPGVKPERMPDQSIIVKPDGTFEHRALRGSRVRLRVTHPLLRTAEEGGEREIVVGEDVPVLRLERMTTVVFRIEGNDFSSRPPDARILGGPHFSGPVQVRAARAESWTPKTPAVYALARDGTFRIALSDPGTWTLRVEVEGHVPIDFPTVQIKSGVNNLGTLRPVRGARLRLRLLTTSKVSPRFARAEAQLMGTVPYTRVGWKVEAGDPPSVLIEGLGRGRFRVTLSLLETPKGAQPAGPPRPPTYVERFVQEVDSPGEGEIVVDVRLP